MDRRHHSTPRPFLTVTIQHHDPAHAPQKPPDEVADTNVFRSVPVEIRQSEQLPLRRRIGRNT